MDEKQSAKIKVTKNGPYIVSGSVPLDKKIIVPDEDGIPVKWEKIQEYPMEENYALCRCGKSKNKPFCDGSHIATNFDGTETADNKDYLDEASVINGPDLTLTDNGKLCSGASFCTRAGGTWRLTQNSDDKESKELAIEQSCNCPSGRLVTWDKEKEKPFEKDLEKSISLEENSCRRVSGPICVNGGIQIEGSDGTQYEKRNRVALCRCGHSCNKPFCDGEHIPTEFNDGDKSINS